MFNLTHPAGFNHRPDPAARPAHRPVELIATAALAASTLVAVMAVSIGIARADAPGAIVESDSAPLAIALLIGLLLAGMGGLTAVMAERRRD